jgi:hypothetical protein
MERSTMSSRTAATHGAVLDATEGSLERARAGTAMPGLLHSGGADSRADLDSLTRAPRHSVGERAVGGRP